MPQKFDKPFWRTLDGMEFPTLRQAEEHEAAKYHLVLQDLSGDAIKGAIALNPAHNRLTAAIERAANEIKRNRRAAAEADTRPVRDPAPGERVGEDP